LVGKIFYFAGNYSESSAGIARSSRFNGRVECKDIDLARDSLVHEYMVFDLRLYIADDVFDIQAAHICTFQSNSLKFFEFLFMPAGVFVVADTDQFFVLRMGRAHSIDHRIRCGVMYLL
jgi:hypothetical protein